MRSDPSRFAAIDKVNAHGSEWTQPASVEVAAKRVAKIIARARKLATLAAVPKRDAALRDMELRIGVNVANRETTPLFCNATGGVYSHGFLHSMLRMVLTFLYGAALSIFSLFLFTNTELLVVVVGLLTAAPGR